MGPPVNVDAVALRASQYWMEDGLVEIMLGLIMAGPSCLFLAVGAIPRGPLLDVMSLGGVQALFLAIGLSIPWGFKKLKQRIAFPRRGYVALSRPTKMFRIFMFAIFAIFAALFRLLASRDWSRMAVPVTALVFALALILLGLQVRLPRMVWEGLLPLGFGALLYFFTAVKGSKGVVTLMVMIGASLVILGALQLRSFRQANPRPEETEA